MSDGRKQHWGRVMSLNGMIRERVFLAWRGPASISATAIHGEPFYGWQTLGLAARTTDPSRLELESRLIYANLTDESQSVAILRAMYWNHVSERDSVKAKGVYYGLAVPATFVCLPIQTLLTWLAEFEDVSVHIHDSCEGTGPVRHLRTERDHVSCVFEKAWLAGNGDRTQLDQRWLHVWTQMAIMLETETPITDFTGMHETWQPGPVDPIGYDLATYRPDRFVDP